MPVGLSAWSNVNESATYVSTNSASLTVNSVTTAMSGDSFQCTVSNSNGTVGPHGLNYAGFMDPYYFDADGTVWCRPPPFAHFSYWRDGAKTAAAWRDGAFTVGDLGRLDDDGYLFLD